MKKNEQDILNIVKDKMENIEVPENLSPAQIEKKLLEMNPPKDAKKKKKKLYYYGGLAAACLVLAAGIYTIGNYTNTRALIKEDAEADGAAVTENVTSEETVTVEEPIPTAKSYEEIFTYLEAEMEEARKDKNAFAFVENLFSGGMIMEDSAESASSDGMATGATMPAEVPAMAEEKSMASESGEGDYSTTNTRQEGVDEADVVKTDGRYLYVLRNDNHMLSIVDTKEGLEETYCINMDEEQYVQEFYFLPAEKKLITIASVYLEQIPGDSVYAGARMIWDTSVTQVITYDVSDANNPKEIGKVEQSGNYTSSRMADGHVYLFTNYYAGGNFAKDEPETYIPTVEAKLIESEDIYLPKTEMGCSYEVITSIDVNEPDKAKESKAIFTNGGQLYVSNNNIYYYETSWAYTDKNEETTIRKIAYDNGKLTAVAQETIDGYINDSFSIDEYEGNLRVIVTVGDTNSVYVMDEELEVIGKIEGLAEEERVYSARFMGATAYFVTFYETDPLFTVDFSNPRDPKIIGKLKIPGFSDYLHFYGEDKLLGIGMDVDEETQVTGGVKLTMFDISDKTDVKEEATYIMGNVYSTDISYDYKAALIDVYKNIICFPGYSEGGQNYYIFSYDEDDGFVCELDEEINGNGMYVTRGVYIKDTLYVVQGNIIEAYSLKTYKKVDDIIL